MESPSPDIRKVLRAYTGAEWEDLWKRLKRFTYGYYWWLPTKGRGLDLDEIIQGAIGDAIEGKRKWPAGVELVTFLCQIIRSNVSHLLEKESRIVSIEEVSTSRLTTPTSVSPASQQEYADQQHVYQKLCNEIRELVRDDPLLSRMVNMWLENPEMKPRDMACEMGVPIEEIRNAQKRLSRRASNLREEWGNV
jgi:DNA-directed RNA polymerase specialized sigma24 family protein